MVRLSCYVVLSCFLNDRKASQGFDRVFEGKWSTTEYLYEGRDRECEGRIDEKYLIQYSN